MDMNNVYGIQLWMGGKKKLYGLHLDILTIKSNIEKYKKYLLNCCVQSK